jgi:hypothetical protein
VIHHRVAIRRRILNRGTAVIALRQR